MTRNLLDKSIWVVIKEYGLITFGLLAYCLGWTIFLLPNNLVGGGVSGFAAILFYATGIPVGIYIFCRQHNPAACSPEDTRKGIRRQDHICHHPDIRAFEFSAYSRSAGRLCIRLPLKTGN